MSDFTKEQRETLIKELADLTKLSDKQRKVNEEFQGQLNKVKNASGSQKNTYIDILSECQMIMGSWVQAGKIEFLD